MIYILDTDVVTLLHADHQAIIRRLRNHLADEVVVTVITRIEILRGRFDRLLKAATDDEFLQAQELLKHSERQLNKVGIVYLDGAALQAFRKLEATKGLKRIGRADLLIASIALALGATLVTRNLKHFRLVPKLKLENWVD